VKRIEALVQYTIIYIHLHYVALIVDSQLNPFTRKIEQAYNKRYDSDGLDGIYTL